jgi:O-antigen ligase
MFNNQTNFLVPATFRLQRKILMGLTVAGLLAIEVIIGLGLLNNRPYLLAIPLIPLFVFYLSNQLEQGILFLLFLMVWVRFGISTGTATKLPMALLFVGLWLGLWLVKMALDRQIKILPSPLNLPTLAFIVTVLVSTLWCRFWLDPQVIIAGKFLSVQIGTIGATLLSVLIPIACINLVRQVWLVKACYWLIVAGSIFYLPFYSAENLIYLSEVKKLGADQITFLTLSRLVNSGGLFPLWFCSLTLALLLFCKEFNKWQKILMAVVFLGWLFRLFIITIVRISGWLPAFIAMLIVLFLYSRKWFFIFCLLGLVFGILNFQLLYESIIVAKEQEGTLAGSSSRGNLWTQAFRVSQDHLILGTGPAGYANYYMTYYRDFAYSTHNNYLDILLQYGLVGLGFFLWVIGTCIVQLWKALDCHKKGSFEYAFTIGAFAGAVGMLPAMWLGDWVIPFAYNQTIAGFSYTAYNWVFIGLALALSYRMKFQR